MPDDDDDEGGGGRRRGAPTISPRSAEALSEKRKRRERKQRRGPTAHSPHRQETGLGLEWRGEGRRGGEEEEEGREKETKTQQVCSASVSCVSSAERRTRRKTCSEFPTRLQRC
ncbi:hypothetical protein EYF80_003591 [Liparis tanakae]|uniref:Uncharacterized protein n=1 Tax=Liparis tanakae TaxID=230148 RepID=A0A4Z2J8J4_9TELE|nr:hypothetical protein EYF80_003591 [Liparis tanakae]